MEQKNVHGIRNKTTFILHFMYTHTQFKSMCYVCKYILTGSILLHVVYVAHNLDLMQENTCVLAIFNRCSFDKRFSLARKYNRYVCSCWMFQLLVTALPPSRFFSSCCCCYWYYLCCCHWWPAAYAIASDFV